MEETGVDIDITGAIEMFDAIPGVLRGGALLAAGEAMAKPVLAALEITTPVQLEDLGFDREPGTLLRALTHNTEVDSQGRGVNVAIGYGNQTHIANFVEYGHDQVTHSPDKRVVGFTPAHPFIRPAFEMSAESAIDAFSDTLLAELKASPKIETEEAA